MSIKFKTVILFALISIATIYQLTAQVINVDYTRPKEYVIGEIKVSGVEFLDKYVLASMSGVKEGDKISIPGDDISNIISKFWKQGLFSDIKIYADSVVGDTIFLDIFFQERPRLSKLNLEGVKKGQKEDLEEKLNLKRGTQITKNVLNNSVLIIKDHYREKGFYNTTVEIEQSPDTLRKNMVDLTLHVDRNDRVKIDDIVFEGNTAYDDQRLRRVMKKTKKVNLNIFKASKLVEDQYEEDEQKLNDFYNERGYRDFRILDTTIQFVENNRIQLTLNIFEGKKYYFRDIEWIGNTKYPDTYLDRILGIEKGDVYDQALLDKRLSQDEDAVSSLYMDDGYLFFSVQPVEKFIDGDSIDLEMRIFEGEQATINNVIIKGNTKTNEHVVRREIRTNPGDLFSRSDLIRTVRELAQLGHFDPETIAPNPLPNMEDGTVDIEYQLQEKANDQLEVSGGWGAGMFVGTIGIRFSNFSARNILKLNRWRPVPSGDGQTVSLRAQTNGKFYQNYSFSFIEPWFGGKKPNSFSFSMFYSKINRSSYYSRYYSSRTVSDDYYSIFGGSIGLGRRLKWPDDYFTLYNELSYSRYFIHYYQGYVGLNFDYGAAHNITFKTTFGRNSQDQLIYPRRGSNISLSVEFTPPYSLFREDEFFKLTDSEIEAVYRQREEDGKEITDNTLPNAENAKKFEFVEHHKWKFNAAWYTNVFDKLVLMTRGEVGIKGFYNRKIGDSPFEGFRVGGDGMSYYAQLGVETIGLRGYENYSLTPNNEIANSYTKYTLELRYPFSLKPNAVIYGLVFAEGGNAWKSINELNPFEIKKSAGVGLRAFLPMFGMLGIDWGYGFEPLLNNGADQGGSHFHFVIGQNF